MAACAENSARTFRHSFNPLLQASDTDDHGPHVHSASSLFRNFGLLSTIFLVEGDTIAGQSVFQERFS